MVCLKDENNSVKKRTKAAIAPLVLFRNQGPDQNNCQIAAWSGTWSPSYLKFYSFIDKGTGYLQL
jgi:hypothetical protein